MGVSRGLSSETKASKTNGGVGNILALDITGDVTASRLEESVFL